MKLKHCLKITLWEIRTQIKLFVFYIVIFISLFSMATALLNVAMYLPDGVGELASKESLDTLSVDSIENISELEELLNNYKIILYDTNDREITQECLGLSSEEEGIISFGTLVNTSWEDKLSKYIADNLSSGEFSPEKLNNNNCYAVWFDEKIAESYKLKIGDEITIYDKDGVATNNKLYVQGVYKNEVSEKYNYKIGDSYFSQNAYNAFHTVDKREDNTFSFATEKFRDIFSVIKVLKDNNYKVLYSDTFVNAIRMMYIMLYAFNFILFIALSGILLHLMDMYYRKRETCWAVNSAIGMSHKDIMRTLFFIYEIILLIVSVVSIIVSYLILNGINNMSCDLFGINLSTHQFSVYPFIFNFILLQVCLFFVLYKFCKKLLNRQIVQLLHCE